MHKKTRIGVMGAYRGASMIDFCDAAADAEVAAICDKRPDALDAQRKRHEGRAIAYYDSFDDFIRHDMDAVVLANYANEHAPFAVRALDAGLHVYSEVLPVQTLREAVLLAEAVERSGKVYAYGENYCYMPAPMEMRRLYAEGKIGDFEYGECEYVHNCEPIWPSITYGEPTHWRNAMYSTFYCTHSLGPILHMVGQRPVSVVGFEGLKTERQLRTGAKGAAFGIEMVQLENGGVIKSLHGNLYKNSIWYSVYGSKGRMETAREDARRGDIRRIYVNADAYSGEYAPDNPVTYLVRNRRKAAAFGHGGSDYWCMRNFLKKIRGEADADIVDVYEALDMGLCGLLAYRSILGGNVPVEIPDMRDKAVRDRYRGDTACTDPAVAGAQLLPTTSAGTPDIDPAVYESVRRKWQEQRRAE